MSPQLKRSRRQAGRSAGYSSGFSRHVPRTDSRDALSSPDIPPPTPHDGGAGDPEGDVSAAAAAAGLGTGWRGVPGRGVYMQFPGPAVVAPSAGI